MPNVEEISVAIPLDLLHAVRASVEAGEYASAGDAVRDAVQVWQQRRRDDAERLDAMRARVRRSIDDPRASLSEADVDARLDALLADAAP